MLEIIELKAFYGVIQALKGVSIRVGRGEMVAVMGANGAGKSTLLMTVCGVVPLGGGEIIFMGEPIHGLPADKVFKRGIVQVPEGRRIFPMLTVRENLDMGAYLRHDRDQIRKDLEYVFSVFPRLLARRQQLGGTLSGGEQQMLAIARALMARPQMLLLDEPSLGLSPLMVKTIFGIITQINSEKGTPIILVEQKATLALGIVHKGYVMENGLIVLEDSASNLSCNPIVRKAYLGGAC